MNLKANKVKTNSIKPKWHGPVCLLSPGPNWLCNLSQLHFPHIRYLKIRFQGNILVIIPSRNIAERGGTVDSYPHQPACPRTLSYNANEIHRYLLHRTGYRRNQLVTIPLWNIAEGGGMVDSYPHRPACPRTLSKIINGIYEYLMHLNRFRTRQIDIWHEYLIDLVRGALFYLYSDRFRIQGAKIIQV
jgi:hypothetical protein